MQMSDGLNELGYPKWQLALCVFVVYVMLYLSLFKGVKSSGECARLRAKTSPTKFNYARANTDCPLSGIVVWGTATLPYLVLTILLIRGLMLPGSLTGITYYLQPELYRLLDTQVTNAIVRSFVRSIAGVRTRGTRNVCRPIGFPRKIKRCPAFVTSRISRNPFRYGLKQCLYAREDEKK